MTFLWKLLDLFTSQWVRVSGESMLPTLRDGQWVRSSRIAFRRQAPQRFDIVRFEAPVPDLRFDVKRIVGLPGEAVELRDGVLLIDGEVIDSAIHGEGEAHWSTGADEYVVLGDNREHSTDSRRYGVISGSAIRGRIAAR